MAFIVYTMTRQLYTRYELVDLLVLPVRHFLGSRLLIEVRIRQTLTILLPGFDSSYAQHDRTYVRWH